MPGDTLTETLDRPSFERRTPLVGLVTVLGPALDGCFAAHTIRRPVVWGRGDDCDLVLADANVSRAHTRIEPSTGALGVTDLGSRNGTWVDGVRVRPEVLVTLGPGSVLRVGRSLFVVVRDVRPFQRPEVVRTGLLVGGPSLGELRREIALAGPSNEPVLVVGETGTGKEHVAHALHDASGRAGPLVTVNCAALPRELFEAELFGHGRGAFSGAGASRAGLFRSAERGTLFLDELGELPIDVQAKLLRAVESGEVRPLGEDRVTRVDVRIVGATHRDLAAAAHAGNFREDLYHRLAAVRLSVPPLRDRREDVPLLARHLLASANVALGPDAMELLLVHDWPGNVRELRNVLRAAALRARKSSTAEITPAHLPPVVRNAPARERPALDDVVARITDALRRHRGNVTRAAKEIGLRRAGMYEAFVRHGIDPKSYR